MGRGGHEGRGQSGLCLSWRRPSPLAALSGSRRNSEHRPKLSSKCLFYIQVGCWEGRYPQKDADRMQNQGLNSGTYGSCHPHRHSDALATALVDDITLIKKMEPRRGPESQCENR